MPVLFPWFLAGAAALMWAASATGKGSSSSGGTSGGKAGTRPVALDELDELEELPGSVAAGPIAGGRVSTMPVGGGEAIVVDSRPPNTTPISVDELPIRSPGLPTGIGTMPVGGGQPIVVDTPPPNSTEIVLPGLPPVTLPGLTPLPGFSTMPVGNPAPVPTKVKKPRVVTGDKLPPGVTPIDKPTKVIPVPSQPPGTVEVKVPDAPIAVSDNPREALASEAYRMLKASEKSQVVKDKTLLSAYQTQEGLDPGTRGVFGPGTGKSFIKYGFVPPKPFWWGKSVANNKNDWRQNMLTMARKDPQRRDEWEAAAQV